MTPLVEVKPEDFVINPFTAIGQEWMLIAAERGGKTNAMTAGWGGLGVMWGQNVAFIVVRPQRYTREFIEAAPGFSLNFFGPGSKKMLNYFGTVSGRDEDKVAKAGLTVVHAGDTPYFAEARLAIACRKLYRQPYLKECFVDLESEKKWYPEADYHTMYIGKVTKILALQGE